MLLREEFLTWLADLRLVALDAVCYGRIVYDDGFWKQVLDRFRAMENKYGLDEAELKELLNAL